ncbi:MAG: FAD-binding oxidoreductase [Acidimicrobiales bacterium]
MSGSTRREFLKASGGSLLGFGAAARLGAAGVAAGALAPAVAGAATGGAVNWAQLQGQMEGQVVLPSNPAFPTATQMYNTRFDAIVPLAVAFCAVPADVGVAIRFARENGLSVRSRNGRHSYGGYSTCDSLVIDVSQLRSVSLGAGASTATIGSGAVLIDVDTALYDGGVAIPAGTCPSVGITGLTLGGGVGETGRAFGLTCDNLLSIDVVLADGSLVTANAQQHPDLLWASQGGGGGNFGIATSLTFRTHPVGNVTVFNVAWPWSQAAAVADAWQTWIATLPDEVFSGMAMATSPSNQAPFLGTAGTYLGTPAGLQPILAPLLAAGTPTSTFVQEMTFLEMIDYYAGCSNLTEQECHTPYFVPPGVLGLATNYAKSMYFSKPLPPAGIDELITWIEIRQNDPQQPSNPTEFGSGGALFDSYGGALNRPAKSATAFVHRDALFHIQSFGYWQPTSSQALIDDNFSWLDGFYRAMAPYSNSEAYQNYIDPYLPDWLQAYYGSNLPRLRSVKTAYDPDDFFSFPQSIPPNTPTPPPPAPPGPPVTPSFTG